MMLPGVELARRRRVHHHEVQQRGPPDPCAHRRPLPIDQTAAMDEPTLIARRRLEEKLCGSVIRPTSPPRSSSSILPRWVRHMVGEGERSRQGHRVKESHEKKSVLHRTESMNDLCAVCLDGFETQQRVMWLPCSHKYHSGCLLPWLVTHSHCPCCRTVVPSLSILV